MRSVDLAVDADPGVAVFPGVLQDLGVLALLAANHRRQQLEPGPFGQGQNLIDDLIDGLTADLLAALGAVGHAHPGPEEPEIVVDLRHRPHGGAGVFGGGLLVDGDGRERPSIWSTSGLSI